jgi:hypothetical protein
LALTTIIVLQFVKNLRTHFVNKRSHPLSQTQKCDWINRWRPFYRRQICFWLNKKLFMVKNCSSVAEDVVYTHVDKWKLIL